MGMIRWAASEAGRKMGKRHGCGAMPTIADFVGKSMEAELNSRTKEFYEFALPPVDIHRDEGQVRVVADLPGFGKDDIRIRLEGNMLTLKAQRESSSEGAISSQRPDRLEKRIRLPAHIRAGEEPECTAELADGVLTVSIPVQRRGRDINLD